MSAMSANATTQQYWGWTIESRATQNADGTWTAHALLRPGTAPAQPAGASPRQFEASGSTENKARSAALSKATGAVDRERVSSGKP